jgi:hypothetical protein
MFTCFMLPFDPYLDIVLFWKLARRNVSKFLNQHWKNDYLDPMLV